MARLALVRDDRFKEHLTPDLHPEAPGRVQAIDKAYFTSRLEGSVKEISPRPAGEDEISMVHKPEYIEDLNKESSVASRNDRIVQIDADTFMSPKTYDLAKLAVGAGMVGVETVLEGVSKSAFVSVRPPGHHALVDRAMGFCFFNNIAIAARYAQKKGQLERILIVDWDVHHGNGTQEIFYDDPSVCFISFHQYPFWPPDCGWYTEDGKGEGRGYNINIPLPAGTGDRGYLSAFEEIVEPVCLEFKPQLILLSAGYDAHVLDPLGQQRISTKGFAAMSQRLLNLAHQNNAGLVCFLEGGYNVKALSEACVATMTVLEADRKGSSLPGEIMELNLATERDSDDLLDDRNPGLVDQRIKDVRRHFARYWRSFKRT